MRLSEYIDGNGLVMPNKYTGEHIQGSDNGPLFTSQALILGGPDTALIAAIDRCIDVNNELHRTPHDTSPDAPDDHYGVLSVAVYSGRRYNIVLRSPKLWHPVLIYLLCMSQYPPLHFLLSPLVFFIIALSNLGTDKSETSNRLLTWTICQALKRRGFLTAFAAQIWEYRQLRIYGSWPNLFKIYFGEEHPFTKQLEEIV